MAGPAAKLAWLDALRGWAILLVILTHASQGQAGVRALHGFRLNERVLALPPWLEAVTSYAELGVQLFFVLSAFSLTLSCSARLAAGDWRIEDFAVRRIARVAPAFWLATLFYLAWLGWGPRFYAPHGIGGTDVVLTLLMQHIWRPSAFNSVVPGGWSIGNEMSFYILLPALLWMMRGVRSAILVVLVSMFPLRLLWLLVAPDLAIGARFPLEIPVFCMGILACQFVGSPQFAWLARQPATLVSACAVALFAVMIVVFPQFGLQNIRGARMSGFAAMAAALCVLLHASAPSILVNRATVAIGRASFSMYLVQFALMGPCYAAVQWGLGPQGSGADVAFLAWYFACLALASFLAGWVGFRLVELPGIAAGRWLIARRRGIIVAG